MRDCGGIGAEYSVGRALPNGQLDHTPLPAGGAATAIRVRPSP